jgi:hypothetical protein
MEEVDPLQKHVDSRIWKRMCSFVIVKPNVKFVINQSNLSVHQRVCYGQLNRSHNPIRLQYLILPDNIALGPGFMKPSISSINTVEAHQFIHSLFIIQLF